MIQRPPETGLFDRTNVARTSQAAAVVTTGGFGSTAASPRDAAIGAVKTGGSRRYAAAPRDAATGAVKTGGFGSEAPAPASGRKRRGADSGVRSTGECARAALRGSDEARRSAGRDRLQAHAGVHRRSAQRARIEGTVSLELESTAAGDVRVLRVVRGLGHGLDEAAQRAALRMRFKPAQSDGRPVDSRATVHITFRLS